MSFQAWEEVRRKAAEKIISIADLADKADKKALYGADTTTRPDADAVEVGTTFVVVADPLVVYMSDGANWVEVS